MRHVYIGLWLLVSLVCGAWGIAYGQDDVLDVEIDSKATELLTKSFTKCGDDFYLLPRGLGRQVGSAGKAVPLYGLTHYKDVTATVQNTPITKADELNGIQWKGQFIFTATVAREFVRPPGQPAAAAHWSEWREVSGSAIKTFAVTKQHNKVSVTELGFFFQKQVQPGVDCSRIPQE